MEFLYTPVFINVIWVGAAFLFGFVVRQVGLPPMIGFLLAGFSLNFMGLTEGSLALDSIADMGVMLLLFTVGLKLDIRGLAKPEIWAGTTIHCLLSVLFFGLVIMVAGTLGCFMFAGLHLGDACFLVLGLGRIGMVAYDTMREKYGDDRVVGIDQDGNLVERLVKSGRRVIHADVSDQEFWRRVRLGNVKLVMLAIPVLSTSLFAIKQLKTLSYSGKITAIAEFDDEAQALREAGADSVYNVLAEAGAGYALHICQALNEGQCHAEVTLSESLASS